MGNNIDILFKDTILGSKIPLSYDVIRLLDFKISIECIKDRELKHSILQCNPIAINYIVGLDDKKQEKKISYEVDYFQPTRFTFQEHYNMKNISDRCHLMISPGLYDILNYHNKNLEKIFLN